MKLYVGITDADWFRYLSERNAEEMNFWRPSTTSQFKILEPNELFLFKSKHPENKIVGGAFSQGIQLFRSTSPGRHSMMPTACLIFRDSEIKFNSYVATKNATQSLTAQYLLSHFI